MFHHELTTLRASDFKLKTALQNGWCKEFQFKGFAKPWYKGTVKYTLNDSMSGGEDEKDGIRLSVMLLKIWNNGYLNINERNRFE